jgi:hypothetical protein
MIIDGACRGDNSIVITAINAWSFLHVLRFAHLGGIGLRRARVRVDIGHEERVREGGGWGGGGTGLLSAPILANNAKVARG